MSFSLHHKTFSLFEGMRKKSKPKREFDVFADPSVFQKEYLELACGETYEEGREHVRDLNIWHIKKIRDNQGVFDKYIIYNILGFDPNFKSPRSTKEYRQQKVQEGMGFPTVKTDLINRILADSDEEGKLTMHKRNNIVK